MKKNHVFIIAEAGVNHNGDFELAKQMVITAKAAGADAVKFQTFLPEKCISRIAEKAVYQKETTDSGECQLDMLKKLSLTFSEFIMLKDFCLQHDIEFMSTAFDLDSIVFLNHIQMRIWKIPSGEMTNLPYLIKIAQTGKPIIASTGMCTEEEVATSMKILRSNGARKITLLHCNTEYPTPFEDVNLKAMLTLEQKFAVPVGYSDHTTGIAVPLAAVALGATVIEKHFTLDKRMEGPDHQASLEPIELKAMIQSIRNIEEALDGDGKKCVSPSEIRNRDVARKSIVAKQEIKRGEWFTEENITTKRPGTGISPMLWFEVLGKQAPRDFKEDELIEL